MSDENKTETGTPSAFPLATGSASAILAEWKNNTAKRAAALELKPEFHNNMQAMQWAMDVTIEDVKLLLLTMDKLLVRVAALESTLPNVKDQRRPAND